MGHAQQKNKARDQKRKAKQQKKKKENKKKKKKTRKKKKTFSRLSLSLSRSLTPFFFFLFYPFTANPILCPSQTVPLKKIRGRQRGMEEQQHACTRNLKNL